MDEPTEERPVLVGAGDPAHVQQLVRTAGDLALLGDGLVRVVTVAAKPHDSPFGVFQDDTIRREFAGDSHELLQRADAPPGVSVRRDVVVARSVRRGLRRAVRETDPAALVVGWQGRSRRTHAVLGTTVDDLIEHAPCDLYVERIGREADHVDSVLLPVAGGPHVAVAARAAAAIASRNEAAVGVLSVATADAGRDRAASAFADEGRNAVQAVDASVPVETTVVSDDDVAGAIADVAGDHDVVVLGATRRGALRRRLVGSVARRVADRTDRTVILARDGESVGGPLDWLGGRFRR